MDGTQQAEGTAVNLVISRGAQLRRVAIPIGLPMHISQYVTVTAVQDGVIVQEEELIPALTGTWRPFFSGTDQLSSIEIFIDDGIWSQYLLDFSHDTPIFTPVAGLQPPQEHSGGTPFVYGHDFDQPYPGSDQWFNNP